MEKKILLLLFLSVLFINSYSQSQYWEDMNEVEKKTILSNKNINRDILKLYQGKYDIKKENNDKRIEIILKTLSENKRDSLKVFYFFVFNQICVKSDGDLSEALGNYCKTFILNNPKYIFGSFTKKIEHKDMKLINLYACYLGDVFFSTDKNIRVSKDYTLFKIRVKMNSFDFSVKEKMTLELFLKKIDEAIKNME